MVMSEDYYQLLEVPRTASDAEIKKAYRRLARKHHPDVNPGSKPSEEKFKKVTAAFEVLSDPRKRRLYDEFGEDAARFGFDEKKADAFRAYRQAAAGGGRPGGFDFAGAGGPEVDLGEIFGEMFGRAGGMGVDFGEVLGGAGRRAGPGRGEDLTVRVQVTLAEVVRGAERSIQLAKPGRCGPCGGRGEAGPGSTCGACGGSGRSRRSRGPLGLSGACPSCGGSGRVAPACGTCRGSGLTEELKTLTFKIPAGVSAGSRIRLAGQGAAGARGGPWGDLYVETEVLEHPLVRREGDDLYMDLPVTVPEAMAGAQVVVPTFQGEVTMTVPRGSQSGKRLRLRGRGVPRLKGEGAGDLYLVLRVMVPEDADASALAAAEQLGSAYRGDVRAELRL